MTGVQTCALPISLEDYKISKDDKISFTISNNLGHKIIDNQTGVGGVNPGAMNAKEMEFIVKNDGYTELPVIGNVQVLGLTITECEDTLAKLYAKEHQNPFVQVRVTNQRVIVFPGNGQLPEFTKYWQHDPVPVI